MSDDNELDKAKDIVAVMTQKQRLDLTSYLLRYHAGAVPLQENDNARDQWMVPIVGDVSPQCTTSISACPFMDFKPFKMVVLEPVHEFIDVEHTWENRPVMKTVKRWLRGPIQVPTGDTETRSTGRIDHKRYQTVARGTWRIHTVLVGPRLQFPFHQSFSGDAFGPDNDLGFSCLCPNGISITVAVENPTSERLTFMALVLGRRATKEELAQEERRDFEAAREVGA